MLRIHVYKDKRNNNPKMMIHTYKKGVLISSSHKMLYCERVIKLFMRSHKTIEICNVCSASDLRIKEIDLVN